MGGNALGHRVARISAKDYETIVPHVLAVLRAALPGARVEAIPAYREKADFGDLDVLIETEAAKEQLPGLFEELARSAFGATTTIRPNSVNGIVEGLVLSFDYRRDSRGFQVDLILQPKESFDYGLDYFSFNDLGNLVGRIAPKMGTSNRHNGLCWYYRDGTYLVDEIVLTRDYDRALTFLGYEAGRFRRGFNTLDEIFSFVASTPYFNPDIYLLENRNHAARTRDRKRTTYRNFLNWCERGSTPRFVFAEDKAVWDARIMEHFPHFGEAREAICRRLEVSRSVRDRFNGDVVSQLTGLKGKELGGRMTRIRESFGSLEAFRDFVIKASDSELRACMLAVS